MSPFGHPTQVFMQVQLESICDYLPVRLARALDTIYLLISVLLQFWKTVLPLELIMYQA